MGADEEAGGQVGRRYRPWLVLCVPVVGLPQPSLRNTPVPLFLAGSGGVPACVPVTGEDDRITE